jgi:hypothetical protein
MLGETPYQVISFPICPKDACIRLQFQITISLNNGMESIIEPSLSIADYLHGLLLSDYASNPALTSVILDLMLYCKVSAEYHKTGADTSRLYADLAAHNYTAPSLTDKLIGVKPVQTTTVSTVSVDLSSGETPVYHFLPGEAHSGSTYRFVWPDKTEAPYRIDTIDGQTALSVAIPNYCLFIPLTIEEYDANGKQIASDTYTVANYFPTLSAGKARDVIKYGCAFAASLEDYRQ